MAAIGSVNCPFVEESGEREELFLSPPAVICAMSGSLSLEVIQITAAGKALSFMRQTPQDWI